jgi:hypothetical protein
MYCRKSPHQDAFTNVKDVVLFMTAIVDGAASLLRAAAVAYVCQQLPQYRISG